MANFKGASQECAILLNATFEDETELANRIWDQARDTWETELKNGRELTDDDLANLYRMNVDRMVNDVVEQARIGRINRETRGYTLDRLRGMRDETTRARNKLQKFLAETFKGRTFEARAGEVILAGDQTGTTGAARGYQLSYEINQAEVFHEFSKVRQWVFDNGYKIDDLHTESISKELNDAWVKMGKLEGQYIDGAVLSTNDAMERVLRENDLSDIAQAYIRNIYPAQRLQMKTHTEIGGPRADRADYGIGQRFDNAKVRGDTEGFIDFHMNNVDIERGIRDGNFADEEHALAYFTAIAEKIDDPTFRWVDWDESRFRRDGQRKIHYNDGVAQDEARKLYGISGSFVEQNTKDLMSMAKKNAMVEHLGSTPEDNLRVILGELSKDVSEMNLPERERNIRKAALEQSTWRNSVAIAAANGTIDHVANEKLHTAFLGLRASQSISKNAFGFVFPPISDTFIGLQNLLMRGSGAKQHVDAYKTLFNKGDKRIAEAYGVGMDEIAHVMQQHSIDPLSNLDGLIGKTVGGFYKYSGIAPMTNLQSRRSIIASHNILGTVARDGNPGELNRILRRHELHEGGELYPHLRSMMYEDELGRAMIDPYKLDDVPADMRDRMRRAVMGYTLDELGHDVIKPREYDRVMVATGMGTGSGAGGTASGEAFRTAGQFVSFGLAFQRYILGRAANLNVSPDAGKGQAFMMSSILGIAMLNGITVMMAQDAAKGRTVTTPWDEEWTATKWMQAFDKGGGLGVMGGFIMSSYQRDFPGRGGLDDFTGPGVGQIVDTGNLGVSYARALLTGEWKDAGVDQVKYLQRHMPGLQIPVIQLITDEIAISLRDSMKPGSRDRIEAFRTKQGQEPNFFAEPIRETTRSLLP